MTALSVLIDGAPLPDDEARAFWKRFSDWMQNHKSDLAGFARAECLASVHPEMRPGGPVLIASHTTPQRPYAVAAERMANPNGRGGGARSKESTRPSRRVARSGGGPSRQS